MKSDEITLEGDDQLKSKRFILEFMKSDELVEDEPLATINCQQKYTGEWYLAL